jgi:hypothetical protein
MVFERYRRADGALSRWRKGRSPSRMERGRRCALAREGATFPLVITGLDPVISMRTAALLGSGWPGQARP